MDMHIFILIYLTLRARCMLNLTCCLLNVLTSVKKANRSLSYNAMGLICHAVEQGQGAFLLLLGWRGDGLGTASASAMGSGNSVQGDSRSPGITKSLRSVDSFIQLSWANIPF